MAGSSNPVQQTIEALAKERGIEPQVVIAAIEDAVLTASRKVFKAGENLKARFNAETGHVDLVAVRTVVETVENPATEISLAEAKETYTEAYGEEVAAGIELGDEMEFPKPTEGFGRIAAQTAKQVIFQKVREAERENIFAEYNERVGEVVTGMVKRFENGDIIVEVGRIETVLPRKEQSRAESYAPGDRVRAVIKAATRNTKGPQIILSRTDPALLTKLFEQEVPEIYDNTVLIKGAVREAGDRAKVAVFSRERDVDPVGACVGMKGTRVQAIIRELRGEKIDIVEWSEDAVLFVTNALSPAKVQRVTIIDDEERVMEVVVEDRQLSLAIGKKGQNVRLAAKLTGWRIDIKSEEEKRKEVELQFEGFETPDGEEAAAGVGVLLLPDIHDEVVGVLRNAGYESAEQVAAADPTVLMECGLDEETVQAVMESARAAIEASQFEASQIEASQFEASQIEASADEAGGVEAGQDEATEAPEAPEAAEPETDTQPQS